MNKSDEYSVSKADQIYINDVVKNRPTFVPLPKSTQQAASTQRVMSMSEAELKEYRNRPFEPEKYYARPGFDPTKMDDPEYQAWAVNQRAYDPEQFSHVESLRHQAKNQNGESKLSSASEERKESARQAFTCTPPAPLSEVELDRVTKHERIKELEKLIREEKTLWDKIKGMFKPKNEDSSDRVIRWMGSLEDKDEN